MSCQMSCKKKKKKGFFFWFFFFNFKVMDKGLWTCNVSGEKV